MFEDLKPLGFDEGYSKGFAVGRHEGYEEGSYHVYESDRNEAFAKGYDEGYATGFDEGATNASSDAYDEGFNNGFNAGYQHELFDDGYNLGMEHGYDNGYHVGVENGEVVGILPVNPINLTRSERSLVWTKTGGLCFYCAVELQHPCVAGTKKKMHVDHLVPRNFGGPNHMINFVPACHNCNSSKSAKDPLRFIVHLVERKFARKER